MEIIKGIPRTNCVENKTICYSIEQLPLIVDDAFRYPRHLLHELEETVKTEPEILESGGCYFAVGFIGHFASHICAVRLLWMPVSTQTFHIGTIETRGQFE